MKDEISACVRFLVKLIGTSTEGCGSTIDKEQLNIFKDRLSELLNKRFENHWFPEKPTKGQGYRCIRVNEGDRKDPVIDRAASQCGLSYEQLHLPSELTIWVDPKEVSCRFGERHGSFCTLASFKNGNSEILLDQVNFDDIRKKSQEQKDKVAHEMSSRKNGRRGFLNNGSGSSPNLKGGRSYQTNYSGHHHTHHGHMHHTPSPAAVSWYNSVNSSSASPSAASDMFSTSPPNQFSMYGLGKFSPPKFGYGSPSKWTSPPHHSYGPSIPAGKGDKYHWFNSNKATIKA